jgi:hypothetical protein
MCTGAEGALISAAISAGGAYMQHEAANDAEDERQKILDQTEAENSNIAKEGQERTKEFAKEVFDPADREKRYDQGVANQEKSLSEALISANNAAPTSSVGGRVSSDFDSASASSKAAGNADAAKQAKLMAKMGGSGLMYGAESLMSGNLASDLGGIGQRMRRNTQYGQAAAGRVRNNGSLAGSLMQAGGSAYGAYGGGGGGVTDGGYSVGQGSAYGGQRRGM